MAKVITEISKHQFIQMVFELGKLPEKERLPYLKKQWKEDRISLFFQIMNSISEKKFTLKKFYRALLWDNDQVEYTLNPDGKVFE